MIRTEQIAQGRVHGHVAHAENPIGGVILLPTIFGIDRFSQTRANMLAEAGMTTFVWNPYPGEVQPTEYPAAMARATKLSDSTVGDMSECISHMLGPMGLKSVAVLGFCLGGRYSLLLTAADPRPVCCVSYYPSIREPKKANESEDAVARSAAIKCPVQLIHGTADEVIVMPVFLKLRDTLEKREAATITQLHPGAVHSFLRGDLQTVPANASATRLSWPPSLAFLKSFFVAATG
jgi:carboxymethylenebutenolidase